MKKFVMTLLIVLLLIVVALFVVTSSPALLRATINSVQDVVAINEGDLRLSLTDLSVAGDSLHILGDFGEIRVADLSAHVSLEAWLADAPFWSLSAKGVIPDLVEPDDTETTTENAADDVSAPPLPLNFQTISVEDLSFQEQNWHLHIINQGDSNLAISAVETSGFLDTSATISLSSNFSAITYDITDFALSIDTVDLSIQGARGTFTQDPMNLSGSVQNLTLRNKTSADAEGGTGEGTEPEPLFSSEPLPTTPLLAQPIQIKHTISKLIVDDAQFQDVDIEVIGTTRSIVLQHLKTKTVNGNLVASANLSQSSDVHSLGLTIDSRGIKLADLGIYSDIISEGTTTLNLDLSTSGTSPAELAGNLSGNTTLMLQNAVMQEGAINGLGSDLVLETLNKLNPFRSEESSTPIECAMVNFVAEEGVLTADDGLVFETDKMKVVGDGRIRLASEEIDVTFSPSAREGLGINVGSLVKFVKLGGTIRQPTPEIGALGILQSGAAITAAVSTGGLSVVAEGMAKRAINAGSACDKIGAME